LWAAGVADVPIPTISLIETQAFQAIRVFLTTVVSSDVEVIRGQDNRVGEPLSPDFCIIWPLLQQRLSTNRTTYSDNYILGFITNNILTVEQLLSGNVPIGQLVFDVLGSLDHAVINVQLDGNPNGTGDYQLSVSRTLAQSVLYCGIRDDFAPVQLSVQLEVHGPNSSDNARIIDTLFRSDEGVDIFHETGFDVTPLYCDEARYLPFINAQQQYEYRWVLDLNLQINPVITTLQQFAAQLKAQSIPVDVIL